MSKKRRLNGEISQRRTGDDKHREIGEESSLVWSPSILLRRINLEDYINGQLSKTKDYRDTVALKSFSKEIFSETVDNKIEAVCKVNLCRHDLEPFKNFALISNHFNMVKCNICKKEYPSVKKLNKHQENKHVIVYKSPAKSQKRVSFSDKIIVHELKEYHRCRKCTKIFESYKLLKAHMKRWHKKRKCYICNYCSKKFVDRMFFKVHIKLHCDICGLLLPDRKTHYAHKRNVCRVLKHYKCPTCDLIFLKVMALKDHSYDHNIKTWYVCDVCKVQCPTKCAIAHHIKFLHSKHRPTSLYSVRNIGRESLYLCNSCDESSVDRDLIEKHVELLPDLKNRVMTGYKDYYFCDHCTKTFQTETEMLQHKWTHFLKTTEEVQPKGILVSAKLNNGMVSLAPSNSIEHRIFKIGDEIPISMQPKVVLKRLESQETDRIKNSLDSCDRKSVAGPKSRKTLLSKFQCQDPVVDMNSSNRSEPRKKPRKTLISKFQCETCDKYFSSNSSLNRHIETQHGDYENLRCKVCEETFFWPSLLKTHKCIRLNHPEMPFDDARPEIQFDNLQEFTSAIDDFNISDDFLHVDFELPAPIHENVDTFVPDSRVSNFSQAYYENVSDNVVSSTVSDVPIQPVFVTPCVYKVVEVPIEF